MDYDVFELAQFTRDQWEDLLADVAANPPLPRRIYRISAEPLRDLILLRIRQGASQMQIAKELGVSQSLVSRVNVGKRSGAAK